MCVLRNLLPPFLWLLAGLAVFAQADFTPPKKKLIEIGWDRPLPSFVAANIREMEQQPFDGVMMKIPAISSVFVKTPFDEAKVRAELEALERIEWGKFTDNFLIVNPGARNTDMDWFSDADWDNVVKNVELVGKAARLGRCKGITVDPEPYGGPNPWAYPAQARAKEKSLQEYEAVARKRGAQFMTALQSQLPNPVVFTFFQLSMFDWLAMRSNPTVRASGLTRSKYGLLPAFLNGMLDVAHAEAVIIDGTERGLQFTEAGQYYRAYQTVHNLGLGLIATENRRKYITQMRFSTPVHYDRIMGMLLPDPGIAAAMTPEERLKWLEHNIYYALQTCDEYAWFYSNRMDWWKKEGVLPEVVATINTARDKVDGVKPLGFDIADIVQRAQAKTQPAQEKVQE